MVEQLITGLCTVAGDYKWCEGGTGASVHRAGDGREPSVPGFEGSHKVGKGEGTLKKRRGGGYYLDFVGGAISLLFQLARSCDLSTWRVYTKELKKSVPSSVLKGRRQLCLLSA